MSAFFFRERQRLVCGKRDLRESRAAAEKKPRSKSRDEGASRENYSKRPRCREDAAGGKQLFKAEARDKASEYQTEYQRGNIKRGNESSCARCGKTRVSVIYRQQIRNVRAGEVKIEGDRKQYYFFIFLLRCAP